MASSANWIWALAIWTTIIFRIRFSLAVIVHFMGCALFYYTCDGRNDQGHAYGGTPEATFGRQLMLPKENRDQKAMQGAQCIEVFGFSIHARSLHAATLHFRT